MSKKFQKPVLLKLFLTSFLWINRVLSWHSQTHEAKVLLDLEVNFQQDETHWKDGWSLPTFCQECPHPGNHRNNYEHCKIIRFKVLTPLSDHGLTIHDSRFSHSAPKTPQLGWLSEEFTWGELVDAVNSPKPHPLCHDKYPWITGICSVLWKQKHSTVLIDSCKHMKRCLFMQIKN